MDSLIHPAYEPLRASRIKLKIFLQYLKEWSCLFSRRKRADNTPATSPMLSQAEPATRPLRNWSSRSTAARGASRIAAATSSTTTTMKMQPDTQQLWPGKHHPTSAFCDWSHQIQGPDRCSRKCDSSREMSAYSSTTCV
jgi:hypothetical protein